MTKSLLPARWIRSSDDRYHPLARPVISACRCSSSDLINLTITGVGIGPAGVVGHEQRAVLCNGQCGGAAPDLGAVLA